MAGLKGTIESVIRDLQNSEGALPLRTVLSKLQSEFTNATVVISNDSRRATVTMPDKKLVTVRVANAATRPSGGPLFRFKRPSDVKRYHALYFGGVTSAGQTIVQRFQPAELGTIQTISIRIP